MKRIAAWLSVSLLLLLASFSPARASQPQSDQSERKVQDLLTASPLKEDPQDDELRKLLKARYNAALAEVQGFIECTRQGGPRSIRSPRRGSG